MSKGTTKLSKRKRTKKCYIEISEQEYKRLLDEYNRGKSPHISHKCQAIIMRANYPSRKDDIMTINDIKSALFVNEKTIDRWISEYIKYGIDKFLEPKCKPRKGKLDNVREQLCQDLNEGIFNTVDHIIDHIQNKFGISIGRTQLRRFLHKNNFSWRMTGHIPGKADPEKQREWVETIFNVALNDCFENGYHLYFSDAVHFVLSEFSTHIWSQERRFLKSNTGRNRINVLGAVNALTKQVITTSNSTYIDALVVANFLENVRSLHPDNSKIYFVLDNARYQHCKLVMEKAESLNIKFLFLPPYSPNLNIIERLWKFVKRKVLYGKYFETPKLFHNAIIGFFDILNDSYHAELKKLLTLKFQSFDGHPFDMCGMKYAE